jgi:hypothetical protein
MLKAVAASGTRALLAGGAFCADNVKAMDISSPQIVGLIISNVTPAADSRSILPP